MDLASAVRGKYEKLNGHRYLYVERRLSEIKHGNIPEHVERYHFSLPQEVRKKRIYFLDIESCGLSGMNPANTITLGSMNGEYVTRTFFAPTYADETAILTKCFNILSKADMVVTYNGSKFDLDRLSKRMRFRGLLPENNSAESLKEMLESKGKHCDLLPLVREVTEKAGVHLADHKLQTLEEIFFEAYRKYDIEGADIPRAYARFVRGGDSSVEEEDIVNKMAQVIEHNILDVASMGALAGFLQSADADLPAILKEKRTSLFKEGIPLDFVQKILGSQGSKGMS